jgi:hypothetical protein
MADRFCLLCRRTHLLPQCEKCRGDIADPHQLRPTCAECTLLERNERLAAPGRQPGQSEPPAVRTASAAPHRGQRADHG